jgi:oligopeptide/dipeptide ABC transporter ATP-binding protein
MTTDTPLLRINGLCTYFYSRSRQAFIRAVDGVDLEISGGRTLGVVGESGSGKSVTALSVMGLAGGAPGVLSGGIEFVSNGSTKNLLQDLDRFVELERSDGRIMRVKKDAAGWERRRDELMKGVRGREIAMIFQNPRSSLNPFTPVGKQITEALRLHAGIASAREARELALTWLDGVKLDSPRLRFDNHPYGLSGGMCQRVMIAMALACGPRLLIADEPTTGLDATIQSKIMDLLADLKDELGVATMLISHDIGVVARMSDDVAVMYGGTVVESGPADEVFAEESAFRHPYTAALLASVPAPGACGRTARLPAIEGEPLDPTEVPAGCRFLARCRRATGALGDKCRRSEPDLRRLAPGHAIRCWLYFD